MRPGNGKDNVNIIDTTSTSKKKRGKNDKAQNPDIKDLEEEKKD